jgi:hypothetical protein
MVSNSSPATNEVAKTAKQAKLADRRRMDNTTLRDNLKNMVNPPIFGERRE